MWLFFKNIKSSSCDSSITKSVSQRGFIYLRTTTDVNQKSLALHNAKSSGIDKPTSCVEQRRSQHDIVRLRKHIVQRGWSIDSLNPVDSSLLDVLSHSNNTHAKS